MHAHVPLADGLLELDPVGGRRTAHQHEFVFPLAEDDHVADDMARRGDRHEMLGAVEVEIGEAVDADMLQECSCLRSFDNDLVHVMGLIEQHRRIAPGALLIAPIGVFRRNHRVYIHADF